MDSASEQHRLERWRAEGNPDGPHAGFMLTHDEREALARRVLAFAGVEGGCSPQALARGLGIILTASAELPSGQSVGFPPLQVIHHPSADADSLFCGLADVCLYRDGARYSAMDAIALGAALGWPSLDGPTHLDANAQGYRRRALECRW